MTSGLRLLAYPRGRARFVISDQARPPTVPAYLSHLSRLRWTIAGQKIARHWFWVAPDANVTLAWEAANQLLGRAAPSRSAIGYISDSEGQRALVLDPRQGEWVAKVPVDDASADRIAREAGRYAEAALHIAAGSGPLPETRRTGNGLLVQRLVGLHPRWDDPDVHRWILTNLVTDRAEGLFHGDVTPWNVIVARTGIKVIDWEKARFDRFVSPSTNVLDFVLRGAAVARVAARRVQQALADLVHRRVVDRREVAAAVAGYARYREVVEAEQQRRDALSGRVTSYLRRIEVVRS